MAINDGWEGFFSLDNPSDTPTTLTSYIKSLDFERSTDVNEKTAWGNGGNRSYRPGLNSPGKISIEMFYDPAVLAVFKSPRTPSDGRDYVYGPDGNDTSDPRVTGKAFITSFKKTAPVDGIQMCTAELQLSGAITDDAF